MTVYVQILILGGVILESTVTQECVNISDFISYQYSFLLHNTEGS